MANPRIAWEFKFSSHPERLIRHSLSLQLGTYFLGCPTLQRITVRGIRFPELRQHKNETLEDYIDRLYKDIKARPAHYIMDTTYWRTEFDLKETQAEVRRIYQDIKTYAKEGREGYYKNLMGCYAPVPCAYLPLCEIGVKDYKDSILTSAMYKPREEKHGKSNDNICRSEGNGKDFEFVLG